MNRKQAKNRRMLMGVVIFVIVVALGGVGLIATGNMANPYQSTMQMSDKMSGNMGDRPPMNDATAVTDVSDEVVVANDVSDETMVASDVSDETMVASDISDQIVTASDESIATEQQMPAQGGDHSSSSSLFDFRWDQIGSVIYNLWVIAAVTVVVIMLSYLSSAFNNRRLRNTHNSHPQVSHA